MKDNKLPAGWTLDEVRELAAKYDQMSNDELAAEIDLASSTEVSAEEAKLWLIEFSHRPESTKFDLAARAIDKLSDDDVLFIFAEAKKVASRALKKSG